MQPIGYQPVPIGQLRAGRGTSIPLYEDTTARAGRGDPCITCVYNGPRQVPASLNGAAGEPLACDPDHTVMTRRLFDCGCLLPKDQTGHTHDTLQTPQGPIPRTRTTLAQLDTCGWRPRPECLTCAHFLAVLHTEPTEQRYSGARRLQWTIGGTCQLPAEGVLVNGLRVHCKPERRKPAVVDETCANCEFCVTVGDWPEVGLMAMGEAVVRFGPDRYQRSLLRQMVGKDTMGLAMFHHQRDMAASEVDTVMAIGAEVVERVLTDDGTTASLRVRFDAGGTVDLFTEDGTTVHSYRTIRPRAQGPVPIGQIMIQPGRKPKRVVVDLKADPWRERFGIRPPIPTVVVFPALPDDPAARRVRVVVRGDAVAVVDELGHRPHPTVLRQQLPNLLARARCIPDTPTAASDRRVRDRSALMVAGIMDAWAAALAGLTRHRVLQPWRMAEACFTGSEHTSETLVDGRLVTVSLPGSGALEPGLPHCLVHLHGRGGLDLPEALGLRTFGTPRSETPEGPGTFMRADREDTERAFDQGPAVQAAMDATNMAACMWDPDRGVWRDPPVVLREQWSEPVRLDLFGATVADNWLGDYDRHLDQANFADYLDEESDISAIVGFPVSNRRRRYQYSLQTIRPRRASGNPDEWTDDGDWAEELLEGVDEDDRRDVPALCVNCGTPAEDSGVADDCVQCGAPLVWFPEDGDRGTEKRSGIHPWRASDSTLQRRLLERHWCPCWQLKGTESFDMATLTRLRTRR